MNKKGKSTLGKKEEKGNVSFDVIIPKGISHVKKRFYDNVFVYQEYDKREAIGEAYLKPDGKTLKAKVKFYDSFSIDNVGVNITCNSMSTPVKDKENNLIAIEIYAISISKNEKGGYRKKKA